MRFAAVIFDLDGTLLDTIADIADSMNAVLAAKQLPGHDHAAYKRFVGDGVEELVMRSLPPDWNGETAVAELAAAYRREYAQRWTAHSRPYPGIPELLDRLTGMGMRLTVLSNKSEHFACDMVARLLPAWRFERVAGARLDVPKKPGPVTALAFARELKLPAERFVFLGDSEVDMRTAVAAGMFPAAALWGFRQAEELGAAGARSFLAQPADVLRLWD